MAMGSPLGPALANIFAGLHESRLFDKTAKPCVYFQYVDDSVVISESELDCDHLQEKLNLLHPALKFKVGKEQNNSLHFLDVLVEKEGTGFFTSIYRKPTFTGQYIRWNSFSPKTRKISFIKTLVHRANQTRLRARQNQTTAYRKRISSRCSTFLHQPKLANFVAEKTFGPEKCPVYIKLSWIGNVFHQSFQIK